MLNKFRKNTQEEIKQDKKRELECENEIIAEKKLFGRVRKSFKEYLEEKYGSGIADKVHRRINKRISKGYFRQNRTIDTNLANQNKPKTLEGEYY